MNINILLSTIPISTKTIGSWNIMYAKLAKEKPKLLSHIIAPKSDDDFINTEYLPVNLLYSKYFSINKYLYNHNYLKYYNRIKKILNSTNEVIIVNIIDDVKLLINLHLILVRNGIRNRVRIIFHLHGYDIYLQGNKAYDCMDTLLVLTMAAYRFQINKRSDISCKVKQFYNGVDQNKFHIATTKKQQQIKNSLGLEEDKVYYLWLSQDRKKKGLHIILEAWKVFIEDKSNVELLIIGTKNMMKLIKLHI
ncbi:glycosyltransferase family protein [Formosa algae]|uniref:hypothetical protein n=1 Tax=Formosa algae TaxID=225843 RepID=UPI000CCE603E|nr:hypothetical protein [Formosa algae]PNW26190.1 hypothetical protein BKP44_17845 [Formosa algae]